MNSMQIKKAETLKELIQNDPYLAFFIEFLHDFGIEHLYKEPIINDKTQTKILAIPPKTLVITQNGKQLEIKIQEAKKIVENLYGPIPLELY
jgi:hypothetical protein